MVACKHVTMTMTVVVANTKGGTGKTTAAVYLSKALCAHGKVLGMDADPQGSFYEWHSEAAEAGTPLPFDVGVANAAILKRKVPGSEAYGFVVIDTPPGDQAIIRAALDMADVVIIPVQAAPMDMKRMWATLDVVGGTPAIVLLSNIDRNTMLSREAREALEGEEDVVVFEAAIPHLQEIRKADGTNPADLQGYGAVAHELLQLIDGNTK